MNPAQDFHNQLVGQELMDATNVDPAKCLAIALPDNTDLAAIVQACPKLPEHIKAAIKALVHTHTGGNQQ